ncbi:hypothetical protein AOCH_001847 [Aspergillus ochraceoroseus]|uniref:MAGE domain-containing protein n=2 Tax=Aspergillus subgen. Nidulantes TaxID=2720870 RepID=A0A0F8UX41_9EURO|nr:hypothetical protein AOCH_001847 [Aspergillus ochraceoroseus]
MALIRKRRAEPQYESSSDREEEADDSSSNPQPQASTRQNGSGHRQRRIRAEAGSSSEDDESAEEPGTNGPSSTDVMVKKLVRLALSSEYSRQPIRRVDISNKVLGEQGSRQFKMVFEAAQRVLESNFGMQLTELPGKEKVTIQQRRAAQKVDKPSSTNKSWILTSTLPSAYRRLEILQPTKAPLESSYTGLYTFIIAVILLNGGTLQEQKLDRYLRRANADTYTPVDRTDRLLQRLCKEGYLIRNREMDGGDEIIEYMVGPRGKVEVGARGVAGLVREVYGKQAMVEDNDTTAAEREQMEEFEFRLARSLGFRKSGEAQTQGADEAAEQEARQTQQMQRRSASEEEEEEDSDY